jgi:hypothetical protein
MRALFIDLFVCFALNTAVLCAAVFRPALGAVWVRIGIARAVPLVPGERRAAWRNRFMSPNSKKVCLRACIFGQAAVLLRRIMRVRSNFVPPTTLSRTYSLSGRTVVKVDVSINDK